MKQGLTLIAALTLLTVATAAQAHPHQGASMPGGVEGPPTFETADRDNDSAISKVEAIQAKLLLHYETFEEIDRDGDGRLNRSEYDLATTRESPKGRHGG